MTIRTRRSGFTLVELLVTVALLLVIMSMFASAFQIATGTLHKHRGIAENDQRARAAVTILEGDLTKRTYRQRSDAIKDRTYLAGAVPSTPNVGDPAVEFQTNLANTANHLGLGIVALHPDYFIATTRDVDGNEEGYFYYSENDPSNDVDDVLQMTVDATIKVFGNDDQVLYTGRARPLGNLTWNVGTGVPVDPDQPIWDDGVGFKNTGGTIASYNVTDNGTSASALAEVSYFVRNGNLYRRVLLIRQPRFRDPLGTGYLGTDDQPTDESSTDFITGNYTGTNGTSEDLTPTLGGDSDFWNDFDSSATRIDPENGGSAAGKMRFITAENLDNASSGPQVDTKFLALGNPQNRFGHDPSPRMDAGGLQGRPKEFMDQTLPETFIGRYTHEETSSEFFLHPGMPFNIPTALNVITPFSPTYDDGTSPGDAVPDDFLGGPREGEELLLPNVLAFDVKVWDAAIQDWADIGHTDGTGDWHEGQVYNSTIPNGDFETFDASFYVHPNASSRRAMYRYGSLDGSIVGTAMNRVFDTWHPGFNFDSSNDNGTTSENPLDDPPPFRPQWSDRSNFQTESGGIGAPGYQPQVWRANQTYALPSAVGDPCRVFPTHRVRAAGEFYQGHQSMFYQVVNVTGTGQSGASEPAWPSAPGVDVVDNEVTWRGFNNAIGLQAIQITIRFLDPSSQQMRQVSLVHSFIER